MSLFTPSTVKFKTVKLYKTFKNSTSGKIRKIFLFVCMINHRNIRHIIDSFSLILFKFCGYFLFYEFDGYGVLILVALITASVNIVIMWTSYYFLEQLRDYEYENAQINTMARRESSNYITTMPQFQA